MAAEQEQDPQRVKGEKGEKQRIPKEGNDSSGSFDSKVAPPLSEQEGDTKGSRNRKGGTSLSEPSEIKKGTQKGRVEKGKGTIPGIVIK